MINGKTYYQVLGVLDYAEELVIRAAYRSLTLKYHPDRWSGDAKVAHNRTSELNIAFETLGDGQKRQAYDDQLRRQGRYNEAADLDSDRAEFEAMYSEHSDAWLLALQFYPKLEDLHSHLGRMNSSLAYQYKTLLLETQSFDKGEEAAKKLEDAFLSRYFGSSKEIGELAKLLILAGFRSAAKDLNRIVTVMGKSVNYSQVLSQIYKKYPDIHDYFSMDLARAQQLLETAGARNYKYEPGILSNSYSFLWTDGSKRNFRTLDDLTAFIRHEVLTPRHSSGANGN